MNDEKDSAPRPVIPVVPVPAERALTDIEIQFSEEDGEPYQFGSPLDAFDYFNELVSDLPSFYPGLYWLEPDRETGISPLESFLGMDYVAVEASIQNGEDLCNAEAVRHCLPLMEDPPGRVVAWALGHEGELAEWWRSLGRLEPRSAGPDLLVLTESGRQFIEGFDLEAAPVRSRP